MKKTLTILTGVCLILQSLSILFFPLPPFSMFFNFYIISWLAFGEGCPRPLGLILLAVVFLTCAILLGSAVAVFLKRRLFVRTALLLNILNILFSIGHSIAMQETLLWFCQAMLGIILFSGFMILLLLYYFKTHFGLRQLFKVGRARDAKELPIDRAEGGTEE